MKKFAAVIIFLMFILTSHTVLADDDAEVKSQISVIGKEVETLTEQINSLEVQKASKAADILRINSDLNELNTSVETIKQQISENTVILEQAQAQADESYENFAGRLRLMYEQGSNAYIAVLLGAQDISDMTKRIELIKEISSADRDTYRKYKDNRDIIASKQAELDEQKTELETQSSTLNTELSKSNEELSSIVADINLKRKEKADKEGKLTALNGSLTSMDYADKLFAEAEKYLGMPYVFGGSTPETSFDCSGFVCYATTMSGVYNLPRTTAQGIYNQCKKISRSEAKRGDIIFFQGTYNAGETVTHVGFYAGDGKMLHCGNPIQYTSIQTSYWQSHFYAFGRLDV